MVIPLSFLGSDWAKRFYPPSRRNAVVFEEPWESVDRVRLHVPEGWAVESFPGAASERVDAIATEIAAAVEGDALVLSRTLRTTAGRWPVDRYDDIRRVVGRSSAVSRAEVVLRRVP